MVQRFFIIKYFNKIKKKRNPGCVKICHKFFFGYPIVVFNGPHPQCVKCIKIENEWFRIFFQSLIRVPVSSFSTPMNSIVREYRALHFSLWRRIPVLLTLSPLG